MCGMTVKAHKCALCSLGINRMASSYGELVLVVGDFHTPHRTGDIHEKFRKILVPNKMAHVLCTGNLVTREQADYLKTLASRVSIVRGDMDSDESLPETRVVHIGGFKIGMCHGHQVVPWGEVEAMASLARQLDVDVMISGHSHHQTVVEYDGRCFVSPGSITGAYLPTAGMGEVFPAFALMSIQDGKIDFFLYQLIGGDIKIARSMYVKGGASTAGGGPSAPGVDDL